MSYSVQSRDPYINTPSTFRNLCRGLNLKQYIYMSAYNDTIPTIHHWSPSHSLWRLGVGAVSYRGYNGETLLKFKIDQLTDYVFCIKLFRIVTGDKKRSFCLCEGGRSVFVLGEPPADVTLSGTCFVAEALLRWRGFSDEGRVKVTFGAGVLLRGLALCARRLS